MGNFITLPVRGKPMTFDDQDHYQPSGRLRPEVLLVDHEQNTFEKITEAFFRDMLDERQEVQMAKNKFLSTDLQLILKKYPKWPHSKILDLKAQFQTFDLNQDGLIDFEELCAVLDELGDESDFESRQRYFADMDEDGSGAVDFDEYLKVIDSITSGRKKVTNLGKVAQSGSQNAQRMRRLSIVQQINHGVF